MKKLVLIQFLLLTPTLLFGACKNQGKTLKGFSSEETDCGYLWHTIKNPTITIKGKKYPIALDLSDDYGDCPDPDKYCSRQLINTKARGNALCKAFGFEKYAKSNSGVGFHRKLSDIMVRLERSGPNKFKPALVKIDHSRSEFALVKTLSCYPIFRKK